MTTLIVLGFISTAALAVAILARFRWDDAPLGSMSERWLAEHRSSSSAPPGG